MLKKLLIGLAILAGLAAPVQGAGTIPLSLQVQFDNLGRVVPNCKLYTIQAGTVSTPQNAYFDQALALPQPNPISCDAFGRLPQFFLADGSIKVRLTYSNLNTIFTADNILVIGPSGGGGGGGGGVDPTTVLATGDMKSVYGTGIIAGFVRANGRTIGSGSSGSTERGNADCQNLFIYLWGADPSLAVSGGRGASAAADWAANKTIQLPDFRGRVMAGFDDMGSSFASRLTTATMTGFGIGSVSIVGESNNILLANLPPYTPTGSVGVSNGAITVSNGGITVTNGGITVTNGQVKIGGSSSITYAVQNGVQYATNPGSQVGAVNTSQSITQDATTASQATTTASQGTTTASQAATSAAFTGDPQGGSGIPLKIVQPTILVTHYMKL